MSDPLSNWPAFVSLAVHELRTPANVVSGYVKMLLKGMGGSLTEQQRDALLNADQSCERIAELLAEMSELARLESGRLSLVRQRTDAGDVLRLAETAYAATRRGFATCRAIPASSQFPVQVDRVRLVNGVVGLAVMVGKHTDSPTVELRAGSCDGSVVITVSNADAPSIPRSALPLQPLDEYMGGVGVTLPLARLVIEGAGGQLGTPAGAAPGHAAAVVLPLATDEDPA
jgi:signal transduction histidine kinase